MKKFLSRKFIVTMVVIIASVALTFKNDFNGIGSVITLLLSLVSGVTYVFVEGAIDKKSTIDKVAKCFDGLTDILIKNKELEKKIDDIMYSIADTLGRVADAGENKEDTPTVDNDKGVYKVDTDTGAGDSDKK